MPTVNQTTRRPDIPAAALMHRPDVSPKILRARIRFAEDCGLRKRGILSIPEPRTERGEEWSHPEAFRDWHGRIVQLAHNYGSPPPAILGMKFVGCFCNSLYDLHVVDIKSTYSVSAVICFFEHLGS